MKVLIWDKDFALRDCGGPPGYLYKIHEYLKVNPSDEIIFYSDVVGNRIPEDGKLKLLRRILLGEIPPCVLLGKIIRRFFKKRFTNFYILFHIYYEVPILSEKEIALMNSVDYIHFHLIASVLHNYQYFKYIKAKTILTTHTPEPNIMEMEGYMPSIKKWLIYKWVRNKILKREAWGYKVVDKIMLPVPSAQEAYTLSCPILKNTFNNIQDKIFYIPTAIQKTILIDEDKKKEYAKYLPSDSFKVCFIGRHNQIKGYDKLQEIAKICWMKNRNINFIIGGSENPIKRLVDPRWIELGWVDTYALLDNIDVFILPNKQTYFDLILLEALRQGVPCIISNTGGNKWFISKNINGIYGYDYDDPESASELIIQLEKKINSPEWDEIKGNCMKLFKEHCTLRKYMDSYLSQIKLFEREEIIIHNEEKC